MAGDEMLVSRVPPIYVCCFPHVLSNPMLKEGEKCIMGKNFCVAVLYSHCPNASPRKTRKIIRHQMMLKEKKEAPPLKQ
jgi:hypothetical protein